MKHQNIHSFLSDKKVRVYLSIMRDPLMRRATFQEIIKTVASKEHSLEKFSSDVEMSTLFDALSSPSLFGGQTIVLLDECDLLKKKDAEKLGCFLEKNEPVGLLLLGAKGKTPLLSVVEKVGSVLDMSAEKPWERDKRLVDAMIQEAKSHGKWLSGDAAALLIEKIGADFACLTQEIHKLICFVGERPNIERSDVFRISATNSLETPWKTAEEIIWENGGVNFDASGFFGLIFSLRAQLQLGAKITSLIEGKVPSTEWSAHFPKVWPKTLEKRANQAMAKGSLYFQKGLETLFKVEMLSRTGASPQALFDLFRTSLYAKR